jgi:hypothetical protein
MGDVGRIDRTVAGEFNGCRAEVFKQADATSQQDGNKLDINFIGKLFLH